MTLSNRFYVYPYKVGSRSARALATALGGRVLRREGSTFRASDRNKVINWGSSSGPAYVDGLNPRTPVARVGNKLHFFNYYLQNPVENPPRFPKWTTSRDEALEWLRQPNGSDAFRCKAVVGRSVLTGHSGSGITITERDSADSLPTVPLYVEYVPKDAEYRVHVFNNEVIDVQRKIRDPEREPSNWQVRSHSNGFIFTRNDSEGRPYKEACQVDVRTQALRAMASSGLTFGAVDVLWNRERRKAYILEVNCAPGLEGETIQVYANAIRQYFSQTGT